MSIYARYVLPRLIDCTMRQEEATRRRARLVPRASGVVLEIGIGSGLNLPFYGEKVARLYGIDSSGELLARARQKVSALRFPVELFCQSAECVPLSDESVDTAVTTWSLCSIENPAAALHEVRRALRKNGRLLFVEHGRSPNPAVVTWQDRLTPLWRRVAGGCHLNRKMDDLIRAAGFEIDDLVSDYSAGPRVATFMYEGSATR